MARARRPSLAPLSRSHPRGSGDPGFGREGKPQPIARAVQTWVPASAGMIAREGEAAGVAALPPCSAASRHAPAAPPLFGLDPPCARRLTGRRRDAGRPVKSSTPPEGSNTGLGLKGVEYIQAGRMLRSPRGPMPPRTLHMPDERFDSVGQCIFCLRVLPDIELTDEHIVPLALSGEGQAILRKGSCVDCNAYANKGYEQVALNTTFLVPRLLLKLKRRKKRLKSLPPVALNYEGDLDEIGHGDYNTILPPEEHFPVWGMVVTPPAGILVGRDYSEGAEVIHVVLHNLGTGPGRPGRIAFQAKTRFGISEMLIAKIAYCFAVSRLGLSSVEGTPLRELLIGKRDDVFNFVGQPLHKPSSVDQSRLHSMAFCTRGKQMTVIVSLFASFDGPNFEVVLGPKKDLRL